jgi:hypothetical protein
MEDAIRHPAVRSRQSDGSDASDARRPGALAEALWEAANHDRRAGKGLSTPSDSAASDDDLYYKNSRGGKKKTDGSSSRTGNPQQQQVPIMLRRRAKQPRDTYGSSAIDTPEIVPLDDGVGRVAAARLLDGDSSSEEKHRLKKTYVVAPDDVELREILRRGLERVCMLFYQYSLWERACFHCSCSLR